MRRLLIGLLLVGAVLFAASMMGRAETEPPSSTAPALQTHVKTHHHFKIGHSHTLTKYDPTAPTSFRLAGITAPVVPVAMNGDELVPPSDATTLGWWGRKAGTRRGVTLLVGHTVHTGGGALDNLGDVPVGSVARVSGLRYRVISVRVVSKTNVDRRAATLFEQDGKPLLVVVTCTDYNPTTGLYASNVVVTAKPA